MKVKVIELASRGDIHDSEYEYYGINQGGVYEVVKTYPELEAIVVINNHGRNVVLYNDEVEDYEEE